MARKAKTLMEQIQTEYPEFLDTVNGCTIEQLEKRLSDYAKNRSETEESRENDAKLKEARALVSELGAPYRDTIKAINMKSKYIVALIKEKGGR